MEQEKILMGQRKLKRRHIMELVNGGRSPREAMRNNGSVPSAVPRLNGIGVQKLNTACQYIASEKDFYMKD